jgi:hypothetical protein
MLHFGKELVAECLYLLWNKRELQNNLDFKDVRIKSAASKNQRKILLQGMTRYLRFHPLLIFKANLY